MDNVGQLQVEKLTSPDYSVAKIIMPADYTLTVEASAMISMDTNVSMETKLKGGLLGGIKRVMSAESLTVNEFTAQGGPGEIMIAPGPPGDLVYHQLKKGETLYLQSSAYVASTPGVETDMKWQGFKNSFFGGAGLFLVKVTGEGTVFFNAYGAILEIPVQDNYVVDTGYIVGFESTLTYNVTFLQGLKTSLLGGEGLVCQFSGSGKVWIQTRKISPFAIWLWPFRPNKKDND